MRRTIVNFIVRVFGLLTNGFPEAAWKHKIRRYIFKHKPFLHKEFLVNRGETAVLIGSPRISNIETTLRIVGSKGLVVLAEPEPQNLKKIRDYFSEPKYPNLKIIPRAISSKKSKGVFLVAPEKLDHKLVIDSIDIDLDHIDDDYYIDRLEMEIDTIDNISKELGLKQIDYIEITINGAEYEALLGMENSLSITKRLFVKAHAIDKETNKPLNVKVDALLRDRGFGTLITKPSNSLSESWGERKGDVYAWKN